MNQNSNNDIMKANCLYRKNTIIIVMLYLLSTLHFMIFSYSFERDVSVTSVVNLDRVYTNGVYFINPETLETNNGNVLHKAIKVDFFIEKGVFKNKRLNNYLLKKGEIIEVGKNKMNVPGIYFLKEVFWLKIINIIILISLAILAISFYRLNCKNNKLIFNPFLYGMPLILLIFSLGV